MNQSYDLTIRPFVFNDAVELIEGRTSSTLRIADRFATASILAAGVVGFPGAFSLLGPKNELVKLGDRLQERIPGVVADSQGIDRTRRLVAAHSVLVITSFFSAAALIQDHVPDAEIILTGKEELQVTASILTDTKDTRLNELIDLLTKAEIPYPKPEFAPGDVQRTLSTFYEVAATNLLRFCSGLQFWDNLNDRNRNVVSAFLETEVPRIALKEYESSLRVLASKVEEFGIWLNQILANGIWRDVHNYGQAASEKLDQIIEEQHKSAKNFEELHLFLQKVSPSAGQEKDESSALIDCIKAEATLTLNPPEVSRLSGNSGASIPPLSTLYVESPFKVAHHCTPSDVNREEWWAGIEARRDMDDFFGAYLTSELKAFTAPLLVLGHPGSGKSSLTRVLASKLPLTRYLPIRVELRRVTPSLGVESQIGESLTIDMGRRPTTWDDVRAATDLTPVLFLDGLDELIQASNKKQGDYLEQIELFQQRELKRRRGGVIVIVTSRTVVADHSRIPFDSLVVKVEDFGPDEIKEYVGTWNEFNSEYFESAGIQPFPKEMPPDVQQLAGQPLLLLLLALLDGDNNAIQSNAGKRTKASIYRQIISNFMVREIIKQDSSIDSAGVQNVLQRELLRLCYIAVGMFNRGIQMMSDEQVLADLSKLGARDMQIQNIEDVHKFLGRFFFVHRALSESIEGSKQAYEFLHSTFGEYLVAHLACEVTLEVMDVFERGATSRFTDNQRVDDVAAMLFAYQPFSQRTPILEFLAELMDERDIRPEIAQTLVTLATRKLEGGSETMNSLGSYYPLPANADARLTTYTCNLLLLAAVASSRRTAPANGSQQAAPIMNMRAWNCFVHLWKSQLDSSEWQQLSKVLWARSSAPLSQSLHEDHQVEIGIEFLSAPSDSKFRLVHISNHPGPFAAKVSIVRRDAISERLTLQLLFGNAVLKPKSEISYDRGVYFLTYDDMPLFFDPIDLLDEILNPSLGIVPNDLVEDSLILLISEPDCGEWIRRHLGAVLQSDLVGRFRHTTVGQLFELALEDPSEDLDLSAQVVEMLAQGVLGRDSFQMLERVMRTLGPESFLEAHPAFAIRIASALSFGGYQLPEYPRLLDWEWLITRAPLSRLYEDDVNAPLQAITIAREHTLRGWATAQGIVHATQLPGSLFRRMPIDDAVFLLRCGALDMDAGLEKVKHFCESWVEGHNRAGGRGLQLAQAIQGSQKYYGTHLNEALSILTKFWA